MFQVIRYLLINYVFLNRRKIWMFTKANYLTSHSVFWF